MSQVMSDECQEAMRQLHVALERVLKHVPDQVHPLHSGKNMRLHFGPYTIVASKRKE